MDIAIVWIIATWNLVEYFLWIYHQLSLQIRTLSQEKLGEIVTLQPTNPTLLATRFFPDNNRLRKFTSYAGSDHRQRYSRRIRQSVQL